jgi:NAD(P)-dependent dehydrogenase (short-subunit alcohol dehydrogenase family)
MDYTCYASLKERVVFVSGGSSGIGAELVRAFAQQGAKVAFCGTRPDGGTALIDEVVRAGHAAPWYGACDVRDVAAYQALLARVQSELGAVRVLVNNAGRDDRHRMEEVTSEFWDDRLALNLKHYFFAIQAVADGMAQAGGGSVINMGSVSWMRGRPNLVGYTTAKAGILGLTRTLARELGPRSIRVNALVPGAIAAGGFVADPALKRHIPLGRIGDAQDLAPLALAVLSNKVSGYVTGSAIVIDGGLSLTNWFDPPALDDI